MQVTEKQEDSKYKYEVKLIDGHLRYECDEPIRGKTVITNGKEQKKTTEQILDDIFQRIINSPGKKVKEDKKEVIKGEGEINIYGYKVNYNKKITLWDSEKSNN